MRTMTDEMIEDMKTKVTADVEAKFGRPLLSTTREFMDGMYDMFRAGADPIAVIDTVKTALTSDDEDDTGGIVQRLADDLEALLPTTRETCL